jgi:hypothetical protein
MTSVPLAELGVCLQPWYRDVGDEDGRRWVRRAGEYDGERCMVGGRVKGERRACRSLGGLGDLQMGQVEPRLVYALLAQTRITFSPFRPIPHPYNLRCNRSTSSKDTRQTPVPICSE